MSSNYLKGQADWLKLLGVTIFPGINLRALSSLKDSSRYVHIFPFSVIMTHNPASSFNHTNLKIVKELLIDWFITNLIGPRLSFESPGCFYFTHLQSNELSFSLCVCVCACVCVCVLSSLFTLPWLISLSHLWRLFWRTSCRQLIEKKTIGRENDGNFLRKYPSLPFSLFLSLSFSPFWRIFETSKARK